LIKSKVTLNKGAEFARKLTFLITALIGAYIATKIFVLIEAIYPVFFFIIVFILYSLFNLLDKDNLLDKEENKKENKKGNLFYIAFLVAASMILKTTFALNTNAEPISDFAVQFKAAEGIASGNASLLTDKYFQTWAYQTGYSIWMAVFIKFFGANAVFFKVLNAVYLTGTNVLVYLFARRFTLEKTARCFGIVYAILPSVYFLTPVLTNQHLSNLLIFSGVYLYISAPRKSLSLCAAAGALLAFGNAVRPAALVAVAAIIVFEFLRFENPADFFKNKLKPAFIVTLSYFVIFFALSSLVKFSGLNPNGLANTFPAWKLIVGLNIESGGTYSAEDEKNIYSISNVKERDKKAMETLKERISVPPAELYYLFTVKIKKMWRDFDSPEWAFYNYANTEINLPVVEKMPLKDFLQKLSAGFNAGIFVLLAVACFRFLKVSGSPVAPTALAILFLIYFGAHLFIEVQTRYRDFAMIPIFALSAFGFERVFERVKGK
jgi:hypothetical protein